MYHLCPIQREKASLFRYDQGPKAFHLKTDKRKIKILLTFIFVSLSALAQIKPTGNVLTDAEKVKTFKELSVAEKNLLKSLNDHSHHCHQSLKPAKDLLEWITTYQLLGTKESVGIPDCTDDQVACLKKFDEKTRKEAIDFISHPHLKDYFKHKKLKDEDAQDLIIQLKTILRFNLKNKSESLEPLYQKS